MIPRPAAAALALLLAAPAALTDVTVVSRFGFDGIHVPGSVTPIGLEVASSEKEPVEVRFEILPPRTLVGVGGEGLVYEASAFLAPGAKKRLTVPVLSRSSMADGEWRLRITSSRRTLLRHGTQYEDSRQMTVYVGSTGNGPPSQSFTAVDSSGPVIGVLGDPALGVSWLSRVTQKPPQQGRAMPWMGKTVADPADGSVAAVPNFVAVSPAAAPDHWLCYEGFDAILWIDPDPESLKDAALLDALLGWAANGGRLLVAATPGARIAADSPLARALPARILGHDDAFVLNVLEGLCGPNRPPAPVEGRVPLATLGDVRGRVTASTLDGRPLAVAGDHGLGTVELLAYDPRLLSGSPERDRARLLRGILGPLVRSTQDPNQNSTAGVSLEPLVNHLRKRFLTSPPLGLLILGLALYVVAIGPADYFLLKRKGKLRRTVITFPLIVIAFTLLAWGASFLLFGGHAGRVRVSWVDFATAPAGDADAIRGLDFLGAYSPTGTTLSVACDRPREFIESPWLGSGAAYYFDQGEGRTLTGVLSWGADGRCAASVDVPLRSQRTVQTRFSGEIPLALHAEIRDRDGKRTLTVRSGLRARVRDLVLVEGSRATALGDLEPGARTEAVLPPPGDAGRPFSSDRLPPPLGPGGLFSRNDARWRGTTMVGTRGDDAFVPADDTESAAAEARRALARAAMGATFAGIHDAAGETTDRQKRVLARHGIDLSLQWEEGRPILLGWCEADPIGDLPGGPEADSTVVVVRRVLPAAAKEEGK